MRTFVVLAAAGATTWILRAALIVFMPSTATAQRISTALRYAAPAAFAALAATALTTAADDTGREIWPFAVAAVVTVLTARPGRNLALPLLAGAVTVSLLTIR